MSWTNYLSAAGTATEFVGFAILAVELVQTNRAAVREAKELAAVQEDAFGSIMGGYDDETGKGVSTIKGGVLGKMIERIPFQEADLRGRTRLILRGVIFTAAGSLMQVLASFGQAAAG